MDAASWLRALDGAGFCTLRVLLSVTWQSSILLGAAGLLGFLLRRRSASLRHGVWVAALCAAPLLPLLAWTASSIGTPRAELPVMPAYEAPVMVFDMPVTAAPMPITPLTHPVLQPPAEDAFSLMDYPWALGLLGYVAVAGAFLLLILVGRLRIGAWVRRGSPAGGRLAACFEEARRAAGLRRPVRVIESEAAPAPMTVGALRPAVLLPAGLAEGLSDGELRALAVHEVAHVKRRDPLVLTVVSLVRAVLFFHPLVWLGARQVSNLAEGACDDAVVGAGQEPVSYARMLARLAEELPRGSVTTELAAGIVLSKRAFLRRVQAILSDRRDRIRKLSRLALAATLFGAVLSLGVALAFPLGERRSSDSTGVSTAGPAEGQEAGGGIEEATARFQATLPNGVTVELVGVSYHPSEGQPWWRPDGSPLEEPPPAGVSQTLTIEGQEGVRHMEFAFVAVGGDHEVDWTAKVLHAPAVSRATDPAGPRSERQRWRVLAATAEGAEAATVRLGVAKGPWEVMASQGGAGAGLTQVLTGRSAVVFSVPAQGSDQVTLTVMHSFYDQNHRLVAVGRAGERIVAPPGGEAGVRENLYMAHYSFAGLTLDDVREFRFEVRPFQWVEFRNASLKPGPRTDVEVVAESLAEPRGPAGPPEGQEAAGRIEAAAARFQATLPNGVTVELVGVSYHPSEGQPWWGPDGSTLAEAPYDRLKAKVIGEGPREFCVRIAGANAQDLGTQWRISGADSRETGTPLKGARAVPDLWAIAASLPDAGPTCEVAFGVAGAGWETFAETNGLGSGAVGFQWGGITFTPAHEDQGSACIGASHDMDLGFRDVRIVAIDSEGHLHAGKGAAVSAGAVMQVTARFEGLSLEEVAEYRFQARSYDWVRFADVSLHPGQEADVKVSVSASSAAESVPAGQAVFGPVIERVVRDIYGRREGFIDFESGTLFSLPSEFPVRMTDRAQADAFVDWMADNGIDAMATGNRRLLGVGMDAVGVPDRQWDELAARALVANDALSGRPPESPVQMLGRGELPATYLFKTREGGIGVLQILAVREEAPRGVRIRYKMVAGSPAAGAQEDLQKRIEAAPPGSVVRVQPGIYTTPLVIGRPITLMGDDPEKCVIELTTDEPCVVVSSKEPVVIDSLTIKWQLATSKATEGPACAVAVKDGNASIRNCRFVALGNTKRCPSALQCLGFSNVKLENCRFEGFEFTIAYSGGAEGSIADCLVLNPGHCGISVYSGSTLEITRTIVTGSGYHAVRSTGGVLLAHDNLIINNKNRGFYLGNKSASGRISNNVILGNGTGISAFAQTDVTIESNLILDSEYAGLGSRDSCPITVKSNVFQGNTRGIIVFEETGRSRVNLGRNTFWGNQTDGENVARPAGSVLVDPRFRAAEQGDFSPQADEVTRAGQGLTDPGVFRALWARWNAACRGAPEEGADALPSSGAASRDRFQGWYRVSDSDAIIPVFKIAQTYYSVCRGFEVPLTESPEGLEWAPTPSSMVGTTVGFDQAANTQYIIIEDQGLASNYQRYISGEKRPMTRIDKPRGLLDATASPPRTNDDFLGSYQAVWFPGVRLEIRKDGQEYQYVIQVYREPGVWQSEEEPRELAPLADGLGFTGFDRRNRHRLTYNEFLKRFELTNKTTSPVIRMPLARVLPPTVVGDDAPVLPMEIGIPSWH